jgi:hypothetical protein
MPWIDTFFDWAKTHETLLWWSVAASLAMCLVTPLAAAWLVIRLPPDYFTAKRRSQAVWERWSPYARPIVLVVKNVFGVVLLVAGLLMLVAPGQGLLTIVAGLLLVDFPGKYRLERWLATRPAVWRSINWLRKRARREPLQRPT